MLYVYVCIYIKMFNFPCTVYNGKMLGTTSAVGTDLNNILLGGDFQPVKQ